jgi:anti-sigma B factor antagonist
MYQTKINLAVRQPMPKVIVVDIRGEVTGAAENALMDVYNQANNLEARVIILNFKDLEYMSSSGIGLLVTLLIRARRQQQTLMACGLNEHYRQIFELTRLNDAIKIYADEKEALTAAGTGV